MFAQKEISHIYLFNDVFRISLTNRLFVFFQAAIRWAWKKKRYGIIYIYSRVLFSRRRHSRIRRGICNDYV